MNKQSLDSIIERFTVNETSSEIAIDFEKPVQIGQTVKLNFLYSGKISNGSDTRSPNDYAGIFYSTFKDGDKEKLMVTTQNQYYGARRILPCFDEPAFKAPVRLCLTGPKGWNFISNTYSDGQREPIGALEERVCFAPTVKISIYLLAFSINLLSKTQVIDSTGGKSMQIYCK